MGLNCTHGCFDGAYSAFGRLRVQIAEVAGYGSIYSYEGFGGSKPWPKGDILVVLLNHSDCEGFISTADCDPLADRLEGLLPALALVLPGDGTGHIGSYADKTARFITGLRKAAQRGEHVGFH